MRKYLFAVLADLTAGVALAFTPVAYTNSYVKDGVTYSQRGGLGTSNYVAVAVNALENNYTALTNNANFKAAVETVSPLAELPEKWALSNVTNNQGGAVSAINVSAFPLGAFIEEFNTSHQWNLGDFCLHNGQLWVAVDITRSGRPWDEYRWEVSTDYTEPLKKWLNDRYIDLGQGGTNIWKSGQYVKKVALGNAYSKWWHMYLLPDYIGLESTDDSEYVRIKPNGYSFKYGGIFSDINWQDVRTTANIVPMEDSWFTPTRNDVITSPYYIHAYLTNHYWQTWEMDDKYLGKDDAIRDYATYVALNASNTAIRAEISTAVDNIKKLWNTDKTQYIDGDGYIWTQDPIHYAWSNQYGTVYNEYDGSSNTWVSPYDTRYKIVHLTTGSRRFQYKYNDEIISQYPDIIPTRTVIQLQTQSGGEWVTFYKFNTGSITYSKTDEIVTTNNIASFMSGYVPETRTVNNKALSSNISLTASDVGAYQTKDGLSIINDDSTVFAFQAEGDGGTSSIRVECGDPFLYLATSDNDLFLFCDRIEGNGGIFNFPTKNGTLALVGDVVPKTRKINGQPLTTDLEIPGMDYPALTNTVNEIKAKFYDQPLQVEWTVRMVNGDMKLYATTNVNTSVLN